MKKNTALSAFAREVDQPDDRVNVARAALVMGGFEYPELDVQESEDKLDRLARAAQARVSRSGTPAVELARFLFDELGYAGNAEQYHDPRNSFLNQVIERRLGIPITLSVLYLAVAKRLGVPAAGVGLPGHFIVRADLGAAPAFIDPFHNGALLTEDDCRERVRAITDGKLPFLPEFLSPVSARYILTRMLNNLKNAYAQQGDLARSLSVVERLLVLNPHDVIETRNLGLLYAGLGRKREAVSAFEAFLAAHPDSPEAPTIRRYIEQLVSDVAKLN